MMNYTRFVISIALLLLLAAGCAQKKEDAAKLEQEMMEQEAQATDTSQIDAGVAPPETVSDLAAVQPEVSQQEEPKYSPQRPEGSGYTVQVAACESLDYAQHLIEKYAERGYEPYMTTVEVDGQTYYRVRLGSFETPEEAGQLKAELVDKYSVGAWIDWQSQ
ncbi:MAG: SPOR domain-containing protein [candidate division Zixibacteria bacterium]|nr:SPOR domain-containing protein [candidate division Zixibacteria bacterium]